MKSLIKNIFSILLAAAVVSSCFKSDVSADMMGTPEGNRIIISGIVTDNSGKVLEDIKIDFQAYPQDRLTAAPLATSETYTTSEGLFVIQVAGFDGTPLHCKLTASDPQEYYQKRETNVIVSWSGLSYDSYNSTFVVNDCSFQLTRATSSANSQQSF